MKTNGSLKDVKVGKIGKSDLKEIKGRVIRSDQELKDKMRQFVMSSVKADQNVIHGQEFTLIILDKMRPITPNQKYRPMKSIWFILFIRQGPPPYSSSIPMPVNSPEILLGVKNYQMKMPVNQISSSKSQENSLTNASWLPSLKPGLKELKVTGNFVDPFNYIYLFNYLIILR